MGNGHIADMTAEEIAALSLRLKTGDREAWEEFINRFRSRAVRYFRLKGCCTHESDDLAQNVFLRAYSGIAGLRNGSRLPAWFDAIVRRIWLDQLTTNVQPSLAQADVEALEFKRQPANEDTADTSKQPWNDLKPDDRELLMLRYVNELTEREIAEMKGLTCAAVKVRLHRIRRLLGGGNGQSDEKSENRKML